MNVVFLTLSRIQNVNERGIYTDLMRKFRDEGHQVYIVFPRERQFHQATSLVLQDGIQLLGDQYCRERNWDNFIGVPV